MGFVEKLRAELVDVIEWVDDSRRTLVWRFPRYHNQIKNGAQLIVRPGQVAVFVHQGRIADVFGPGQHRLETRNLPVLSTLAGWLYGFDSPFKAEVYFVSTRQITDLRWGTPNPVPMRDRELGPVRVRAFGTYTLRAADPKTLLTELVGANSEYAADEIHELLRSIINQCLADVVAKAELGVLDLAAHYPQLSEPVRRSGCCSPSAESMNQRRIISESCLQLVRVMTRVSQFIFGSEWNRCLVARNRRSFYRPILVMKRGLNNSRSGCRRPWPFTRPKRRCPRRSCRLFGRAKHSW